MNPVVAAPPLAKAKDGRLLVNGFFEVEGAPGVYALGDNAAQPDPHTGEAYVATAQVALRQAGAFAAQIEAALTGRARWPFRFKLLGEMVPLSRWMVVADLMGLQLLGSRRGFCGRRSTRRSCRPWRRCVRVVLDWTVELFFERDVSELTVDEKAGG